MGCACLKSGGFGSTFGCTGKGYVERGALYRAHFAHFKSGGFGCKSGCTGKGYVERERERGALYSTCFARSPNKQSPSLRLVAVVTLPVRLETGDFQNFQ